MAPRSTSHILHEQTITIRGSPGESAGSRTKRMNLIARLMGSGHDQLYNVSGVSRTNCGMIVICDGSGLHLWPKDWGVGRPICFMLA